MWYFQPYTQQGIHFRFESILEEVDMNEKLWLQQLKGTEDGDDSAKNTVCKLWVDRRCDKGIKCQYSHVFDRDRMEECKFWKKYHDCSNHACRFRHGEEVKFSGPCKFYIRGHCNLGNQCPNRHNLRDLICLNYLAGFCPDGPDCLFAHPKWESKEQK
jgi:cleavage and polyadenylation specificity factor subunit 4